MFRFRYQYFTHWRCRLIPITYQVRKCPVQVLICRVCEREREIQLLLLQLRGWLLQAILWLAGHSVAVLLRCSLPIVLLLWSWLVTNNLQNLSGCLFLWACFAFFSRSCSTICLLHAVLSIMHYHLEWRTALVILVFIQTTSSLV